MLTKQDKVVHYRHWLFIIVQIFRVILLLTLWWNRWNGWNYHNILL